MGRGTLAAATFCDEFKMVIDAESERLFHICNSFFQEFVGEITQY